jgi:aspartyl protease family protein
MATGFISGICQAANRFANIRILPAVLALMAGLGLNEALAANITVVGLFPGKALIVVNGAAPRTLSIGQSSPEGVKLIATDSKSATLEFEGKKQVLEIGEHFATSAPGSIPTVTLSADTRGNGDQRGTGVQQHAQSAVVDPALDDEVPARVR